MRRTLALAALACTLAGCRDALGIGGSAAMYDVAAHTEITYTDIDHPEPRPTYFIAHDYTGKLLLAQTGKTLRVVLRLRRCEPVTGCSTHTFRSRDEGTHDDGNRYFIIDVFNDDGEGPYGFTLSGAMRPEGFTGSLIEMGGRYSPRGTFVATHR